MTKKIRMSAVIDNSTMGLSLDTQMEITKASYMSLRSAFNKATKHGIKNYNVRVELISGHRTEGSAIYIIRFIDKTKAENCVQYEFKKSGNVHFINVTGNPTIVVAGSNDIPILIKGFDYGTYNAPTITFKYLNRIMYAMLDKILAEYDFLWSGVDKKKLVKGDISIQRYQIAWYSGDLDKSRTPLMLYLRAIYCGTDATKNYVRNVVESIGINGRAWPNSEENITIEAKSGDRNKSFSLTLYAKDKDPKYAGMVETERVSNLIRWDCSLFNAFLNNNKIKKICDLEDKYIEVCEEEGYDIGFIRFISDKIQSQLKFSYLISIDLEEYKKSVKELANIRGKNEIILRDYWLTYGDSYSTSAELARRLNMKESTLSEAKKNLSRQTAIDFGVPRSTHEAILFNRENATLDEVERGERLLDIKGVSNSAIRRFESVERDKTNAATFSKLLKGADVQGALRIRKFTPIKVTPEKFWIYNSPPFP